MTPEEAIEILEEVKELDDTLYAYSPAYMEALEVAISTLKEGQQYHKIGTVEECREGAEKQKPKKPEYYGDSEDGRILCPTCKEDLWDLKECGFNTCPYCGQKLDWSEK